MINPLRSEAEAFRFLIGTIAYFAAIAIASVLGGWEAGVPVFVVLSAIVVGWWMRARRAERPERTRPLPHAEGERRILVIANETVGGRALRDLIAERSRGVREEVLVVTPALNSPLRNWTSDEDGVRKFGPDEIIISTHPEGRSHWLEAGVVSRARDRFAVPITHVVVDLEAERA